MLPSNKWNKNQQWVSVPITHIALEPVGPTHEKSCFFNSRRFDIEKQKSQADSWTSSLFALAASRCSNKLAKNCRLYWYLTSPQSHMTTKLMLMNQTIHTATTRNDGELEGLEGQWWSRTLCIPLLSFTNYTCFVCCVHQIDIKEHQTTFSPKKVWSVARSQLWSCQSWLHFFWRTWDQCLPNPPPANGWSHVCFSVRISTTFTCQVLLGGDCKHFITSNLSPFASGMIWSKSRIK